MEKVVTVILILSLCLMPVQIQAKSVTSGTDNNGNKWTYHTSTKTLTFTGNKDISDFAMNGHDREPSWYRWSDKTEHIVIEEGITGIGSEAFAGFVKVLSVNIPYTVKKIKRSSFENNYRLREIQIPNEVISIGDKAFAGCYGLKNLSLPSKLNYVGSFEFCRNIKSISLPDSIKDTADGMFTGCEMLTSVKLPRKLKAIKAYDFADCRKLTKLNIPVTVKVVYMSAFAGSGLKKIVLPSNVQKIRNGNDGQKVFEYIKGVGYPTKNLRVIEIHSKKVKSIQKNSFSGLSSKVVIKVPKSKKKKYTKMLRKSGLSKKVKICNL